ncbi:hypothetical protein [Deefgea piscis]|uniref:hypothetical protein n=1 Tax=Deefgea piscis TaxID=2739061 RepID=UPI001C81A79A|nr:hypothetical protein [Deefgea piscis]QZA80237.1 hypothetical protein K4H25_11915 [Deefgea piscis]
MKTANYRYQGPITGLHLAEGQELVLINGMTVQLPVEHERVQMLAGLGHLTIVEEPENSADEASKAPVKTGKGVNHGG